MNKRSKERRDKGALELDKAGKAPHAAVHAEKSKNKNAEKGIGKNKTSVGEKILSGNSGKAAVKAEPEGEEPGGDDRDKVISDEKGGDDLPMLQWFQQQAILFSVILIHGKNPI